jgi:phosphate transport system substrate-binding protein
MKTKLFISIFIALLVLAGCNTTNDNGFESEKINVYTRDTSSGTRDGFMSGIGFKDASSDDSVLVSGFITNNNAGIMTAMTTDIAGIGYVSLSSVNNTIKALNFEGVEATEANVLNDTYGLKRPFVYMRRVDGDYVNDREYEITLAFIAFMESNDGADVINDEGATAVNGNGNWASLLVNHPVCELNNSDVTLNFGGSDSITRIAESLSAAFSPRCGNVQTVNNHTGSSDGYKRSQGEEKDGVNAVHIGYSSRPFRDGELSGPSETRGQLAWDAIVAIVHKDNPVDNVTADQLVKIYKGELATWGAVIND